MSVTRWMAFLADSPSEAIDVHRAVVLYVDLDAGLIDDAADHLAARPDQLANLVGRDG